MGSSLLQKIFNILVIIIALYFFWLTANYRSIVNIQLEIDQWQTSAIMQLQKHR